jgi:hypothetical protein
VNQTIQTIHRSEGMKHMPRHQKVRTAPPGDPGVAIHHLSGRLLAAVDADDGYLWVRDLDHPDDAWDRLPPSHRGNHVSFTPALADQHGWYCDDPDTDLWCSSCLRMLTEDES